MEKIKHYAKVNGTLVEVSAEVKSALEDDRKYEESYLRQASRNKLSFISNLKDENNKSYGYELIKDESFESITDILLNKKFEKKLYTALSQLSKSELAIIEAIYFYKYSERDYAKISGLKKSTINFQKNKILKKLRNILEN